MRTKSALKLHGPCLSLMSTVLISLGCQQYGSGPDESSDRWEGFEPFVQMEAGPTYHSIDGYDPAWLGYVREGVEMSRAYWGSYGPTHVWVVGSEDGSSIKAEAKQAFLEEYCSWRTASSAQHSFADCMSYAEERIFDRVEDGDSESWLSDTRDTEPRMAELFFLNVHEQFREDDLVPGPFVRGVHEYTHVFQMSFGELPTWMVEGGAVFAENWIPWLEGRGDPRFIMMHLMRNVQREMRGSELSIADMEAIETAPRRVAKHYLHLAYYSGAWATAFMIHKSSKQSVSTLRDEFYPLVKEIGWEGALSKYVGMQSKEEFYTAFEGFMDWPLEEQLSLLDELKP